MENKEIEGTIQSTEELPRPSASPIVQQAVAQLSWAHNVVLLQKVKDLPNRLWYAQQALSGGWSRDTLTLQIKNCAHERQDGGEMDFPTAVNQGLRTFLSEAEHPSASMGTLNLCAKSGSLQGTTLPDLSFSQKG